MKPRGTFLLLLSMMRSVMAVFVDARGTILTQSCFFLIAFSPLKKTKQKKQAPNEQLSLTAQFLMYFYLETGRSFQSLIYNYAHMYKPIS
jgi:hypothetical protein